jgi:hypothetical protein
VQKTSPKAGLKWLAFGLFALFSATMDAQKQAIIALFFKAFNVLLKMAV